MTQHELAARIGCHDIEVSTWERGKRTPRLKALAELSIALGVSTDRLIFGGEQPYLPYAGGTLGGN